MERSIALSSCVLSSAYLIVKILECMNDVLEQRENLTIRLYNPVMLGIAIGAYIFCIQTIGAIK